MCLLLNQLKRSIVRSNFFPCTGITPSYDLVVKTNAQNFPSTEQTKKIMLALFADDGLFVKDDFQRSGEIHLEGCQHN